MARPKVPIKQQKTKQVLVRLTLAEFNALRDVGEEQGCSTISVIARMAIKRYVDSHKKG